MKSQTFENFLKNKTVSYIGGPILFTAPHSKRLYRGGPKYGEKVRVHERQAFTSWIASQLATLTSLSKKQPNSFMVWGKSASVDEKDMDPNYLLQDMLSQSQFHQSLHYWAFKHEKIPILHVDVHGKLNRDKNCQIDVGIRSMEVHWENDPLISAFKPYFQQKLSKIFTGIKYREFECKFNTSPYLHGYWGDKMVTMTQQAIMLGIPSFQLEIPREVRKSLSKNPQLMLKFANGIKDFYLNIVVPYYKQKTKPLRLSKQIALKFKPTVVGLEQLQQAQSQITVMEQKYELNVNAKKI